MHSIPKFPNFKLLELNDKDAIEKITSQYEPYSDYNFVSLWSYNVHDDISISLLNNNLVVKFRDYITNEPFYSFIGDSDFEETVIRLLEFSALNNLSQHLSLIPESNLHSYKPVTPKFTISEDRDHFDYIYMIKQMSDMPGIRFKKKRNKVNKYIKMYPNLRMQSIDVLNVENQINMINLFKIWEQNKKNDPLAEHELTALKRLFQYAQYFDVLCLGAYDNNQLRAFSLTQSLIDKYAIFHFVKADASYPGLFEFVYTSTSKELSSRGSLYINREQDLGLPGLREGKEGWRPIRYLKKYKITP